MLIVHVAILVKSDSVDDFVQATLTNVAASRLEAGISQFDLLQSQENPRAFLLVEAYRTTEAQISHKETSHYKTWAKTVEPFMVRKRQSSTYESL